MKTVINIIALVFLCLGAIYIFFRRDLFKDRDYNRYETVIGFVVCALSLVVIYFVNR